MRKRTTPYTIMGRAENLQPRSIIGSETRHFARPVVVEVREGRQRQFPLQGFIIGAIVGLGLLAMFWPVIAPGG